MRDTRDRGGGRRRYPQGADFSASPRYTTPRTILGYKRIFRGDDMSLTAGIAWVISCILSGYCGYRVGVWAGYEVMRQEKEDDAALHNH